MLRKLTLQQHKQIKKFLAANVKQCFFRVSNFLILVSGYFFIAFRMDAFNLQKPLSIEDFLISRLVLLLRKLSPSLYSAVLIGVIRHPEFGLV